LAPEQKIRLLQIAGEARRRVDFRLVNDNRTMFTTALPMGLLSERYDTPYDSRYASADGQLEIIVARFRPEEKTLRDLFDTVANANSMKGCNAARPKTSRFSYLARTICRISISPRK
jgi:hypothetical protein